MVFDRRWHLGVGCSLDAHTAKPPSIHPLYIRKDDMPFSLSAAARHGTAAGADRIRWIPYDMPFTTTSGARAAPMCHVRCAWGEVQIG